MDDTEYCRIQEQRRGEHLPFDVEQWQHLVADLTFPTHFLPMTLEQARAVIALYQFTYNHKAAPEEQHYSHLAELEVNLALLMARHPSKHGWFARLSTRSPKDAVPVDRVRFDAALEKNLLEAAAVQGVEPDSLDDDFHTNARMVALCEAQARSQVFTARQALELICSSERTFVDLMMATHAKKTFADHPMCIAIREWEPLLSSDYEFRAFVHNDKLTAISQYNHYCYFPSIADNEQAIATLLRAFWERAVQPALTGKLSSYVVDFAILTDGTVRVVELNPYATTTGSALFDWRADRALLEEGPFEMRVHHKPLPNMREFVDYCVDAGLTGQPVPAYFQHTKKPAQP